MRTFNLREPSRRHVLVAAMAGAGAQVLSQGPAAAASPAVFGPLRQADAGVLNVGYVDSGPAADPAVILLHGWPYDIHAFAEVTPLLTAAGYRVIVPHLRGFGTTHFRRADATPNAQQAALGLDVIALMDALKIESAVIAGFDWGARAANVVAALWPARCKALVSVSGYLITAQTTGAAPLSPQSELAWWYQFYFATERGRLGYARNRYDFAKLIWRIASPQWRFEEAIFDRSAASLCNRDHAAIVIHNYRWRLGLAESDPTLDGLERQLAMAPVISAPTITMEGDANGAPHPQPNVYAKKFSGPYHHRLVRGGVGHNLPQEAPKAFADAILDIARSASA